MRRVAARRNNRKRVETGINADRSGPWSVVLQPQYFDAERVERLQEERSLEARSISRARQWSRLVPAVFLLCSRNSANPPAMPDADEKLTPADPADLAEAIAFALRYSGRKRVHQADEYMANRG